MIGSWSHAQSASTKYNTTLLFWGIEVRHVHSDSTPFSFWEGNPIDSELAQYLFNYNFCTVILLNF